MKRIRLLGAAIIAVLALGVVGVSTAAAAPELGATSLPAQFTSTGVGKSELKSAVGTITCSAHSSKGEFTSQTDGIITIAFTGCEAEGVKCKTTGAAAGEIVVSKAPILIVSLKSGSTLLGGLLIGITLLTITCGVLKIEVKGSVLGVFPSWASGVLIDTTETKELSFKEASGKQEYTTCEGGALCGTIQFLEANFGTGFKEAVQVSKDTVKFGVSIKVTF